MSCKVFQHWRGARYIQPVELYRSGFDWTGTRVRIVLKEDRNEDSPAICTFDTAGGDIGTTFAMAITDAGTYSGSFEADGNLSEHWPDVLVGDLWVYRHTPLFGPYIVAPFEIRVKQPATTV